MTPMNWRVQGEEVSEPEPVSSSESAGDLDSKWRELYRAARRIKELAPWDWMEEVDVFGIEFPGINEIGFVSVMGMLGEHISVSVYLGKDTGLIFGYELLQALGGVPAMLREIPGAALAVFKRAGFRPSRIDIQSFRLHQLLAPLFKAAEINVSFCESLPAIEEAKKSLRGTLSK